MSDTNPFGGKNSKSLYVPMSETEQEALERMIESEDLELEIKEWGKISNPKITFGDLRIAIPIKITFNAPEIWIPVHHFDLSLQFKEGPTIFSSRESVTYGGQPILVGAGTHIDMVWDIAIEKMDPKWVKQLVPGAVGLTTRVGNMHLTNKEQKLYNQVRAGEKRIRELSKK